MLLRAIFLLCCSVSLWAQTKALGPLRFGEKNPFYRLYATPRAESGALLPAGAWSVFSDLSHSNVFERAANNAFAQDFDMEITTLNLGLRRAFTKWEFGAEVSFDSYAGGFLDHTIQEFHSVFGLANDDRDEVPNDRFAFGLLDLQNRQLLQASDKEQWLLGDLVLHAKRQLRSEPDRNMSLWAQLRVPTGEEDVNSSGSISANVGLAWQRSWTKWHMYTNLSAIWINPSEPRSAIVNDAAIYGMFALERHVWRNWSALVQLDGGSPYVDGTGLSNLDDPPLNFVLGLQTQFGQAWHWQLGFSEDLLADGPSVDFSVETSLRKTF